MEGDDFSFLVTKLSVRASRQSPHKTTSLDSKESNFLKFSATASDQRQNTMDKRRMNSELMGRHIKDHIIMLNSGLINLTNISLTRGASRNSRSTEVDFTMS